MLWFAATNTADAYFPTRSKKPKKLCNFFRPLKFFILHVTTAKNVVQFFVLSQEAFSLRGCQHCHCKSFHIRARSPSPQRGAVYCTSARRCRESQLRHCWAVYNFDERGVRLQDLFWTSAEHSCSAYCSNVILSYFSWISVQLWSKQLWVGAGASEVDMG